MKKKERGTGYGKSEAQKDSKAKSYYEVKQRVENEGISPKGAEDSGRNFSPTYQHSNAHTCVQTLKKARQIKLIMQAAKHLHTVQQINNLLYAFPPLFCFSI